MKCPKCHSNRNIICLAGGIVLAQAQQMSFYCFTCEQDFVATKKELGTGSRYLSFEVIAIDQNLSLPRLSGNRPNILTKWGSKRKEW